MALRIGAKFDEDEGFLVVRAVDERGSLVAEWSLLPISMEDMMAVHSEIEMDAEAGIADYEPQVLSMEAEKLARCLYSWSDVEGLVNRMVNDVFWLEDQTYARPIGVDGLARMLYVAASMAGRFWAGMMAPVCTEFVYGSWVPRGMAQAWKHPAFRRPDVIVSGPVAFVRPAIAGRVANPCPRATNELIRTRVLPDVYTHIRAHDASLVRSLT